MIKIHKVLLSYLFLRQEGIEPPVQPHFSLCIDGRVACYHYTIGALGDSELPGSNRRHFDNGYKLKKNYYSQKLYH